MWDVDFDRTPFLVIWETTQACDLACRHCRASAIPGPIPGELSTAEGRKLIDDVAALGTPLMVLSGGDPASRPDLLDLVRHGKSHDMRMATIPAATPRLTPDLVRGLKIAGLDQIAFSIDFPREDLHDSFRGVAGSFRRTVDAVGWAKDAGLPPQINSCIWGESAKYLPEMAALVEKLGAVFWEVFFLVPTGRGTEIAGLTAERCEELFPILLEAQNRKKFILKVTEAPHYRRYLAQRQEEEHGRAAPRHAPAATGPGASLQLARRGVNAGNGFLFVSHLGEMYPSGFLPASAGNVRTTSVATAYRESELFRSLRNPAALKGRCGRCPFAMACGGSRSRAHALTGDWLETDPWCGYQPAAVNARTAASV
ncbi:MAG: TIGR04053 family radical SAM/SPASM domain-containing protein [Planctomycetes bacterium]|nr:TIGR04053 family radical SAM/SPASM domain-containing protein [Planctomycetota bacterium]